MHTSSPGIISEVIALMNVKANILAYATVFHVSGFLIAIGALTALLMKDAKQNTAAEHVMVEV